MNLVLRYRLLIAGGWISTTRGSFGERSGQPLLVMMSSVNSNPSARRFFKRREFFYRRNFLPLPRCEAFYTVRPEIETVESRGPLESRHPVPLPIHHAAYEESLSMRMSKLLSHHPSRGFSSLSGSFCFGFITAICLSCNLRRRGRHLWPAVTNFFPDCANDQSSKGCRCHPLQPLGKQFGCRRSC